MTKDYSGLTIGELLFMEKEQLVRIIVDLYMQKGRAVGRLKKRLKRND